jgi:hypothetical protein
MVQENQIPDVEQVVQPGDESPPADAEAPRVYSQEEFSASQSAKDKEIAALRTESAREKLQNQINQVEATEAEATAVDQESVEAGTMTQEVATQRQTQRRVAAVREFTDRQDRENTVATHTRMSEEVEVMGRVMAAEDFGKQYGVDPKILLEDKGLRTWPEMKVKAADLALEEAKTAKPGTETYDSGRVSTSGANVDNMSPTEKIALGLSQSRTRK